MLKLESPKFGAGFPLDDLSDQLCQDRAMEESVEFENRCHYSATGAVSGAWLGWLLGLCIGEGFLSFPNLGLVVARGSVLTAFLAGIAGGIAGTLIGGLVGAFISWTLRQKDTRRC